MNHRASPRFWRCYHKLPVEVQRLADRDYQLLLQDSRHPSLHLKRIGNLLSVRVGLHYRMEDGLDLIWFWIGTHSEYDELLKSARG